MDLSDLPWLSAGRGMSNAGLDGNSYEQMTRDLQTILERQEGGRGRLTSQSVFPCDLCLCVFAESCGLGFLRRQIRELTTTLPKLSEEQLENLGHHGAPITSSHEHWLVLTRPLHSHFLMLNSYRCLVRIRIIMPNLHEHIPRLSRRRRTYVHTTPVPSLLTVVVITQHAHA